MSESMHEEINRRDFLKLGVSITAGVVVPPVLTACGGGGDGGSNGPTETFVEPLNIQSVNGVLDVTLVLSYLTTKLFNPATGKDETVTLRNMFGTIPAPTLRMRVGDLLRIKVFNNFPPNPPYPPPTGPQPPATLPWPQPTHLQYPNSTNLHTHGLHVYPDIYPQPFTPPGQSPNTSTPPKVYGDFVVDDPEQGIKPGETRQYEYRIRDDHPAGTYWYHPHLHGSSAMQVGSGMAGALIIEGPIDDVPEIAAAQERVFVFQAPLYDPATGKLESFAYVASITNNEPPFMINGVRRPTILMKSGEVQNWRFINAGTFNMLNLSLQQHTFYQYSHDGNPRRTLKLVPPLPDSAMVPPTPPPATYPEAVVLAVANRTNVLVRAGAPGTYQLRNFSDRERAQSRGRAAGRRRRHGHCPGRSLPDEPAAGALAGHAVPRAHHRRGTRRGRRAETHDRHAGHHQPAGAAEHSGAVHGRRGHAARPARRRTARLGVRAVLSAGRQSAEAVADRQQGVRAGFGRAIRRRRTPACPRRTFRSSRRRRSPRRWR